MTAKRIRWGACAGEALARGADVAADLVGATLGPAGRSVLVGRSFAAPLMLRGGHTLLQQLELEDADQQMGVQAMRELAWRTSEEVGDGTSTAIVMARALLRAGLRAVSAGIAPADLQDAIDAHAKVVLRELASAGRPVSGRDQLVPLATQAAGGDTAIGALVADAHEQVGPHGVVQVQEGRGSTDEIEIVPGLHFDQGWISPHFVDDPKTQSVEIDDPLIIMHLGVLNDLGPIVPMLEMVAKAHRGLVLIAENVGGEALATLVVNKQRAGFKVAAVKAPGAGAWRALMLDDIAVATGGAMVAEHLGTRLEHLRPQMAGRAARIRITRSGTIITGGRADPAAIDLRRREIRDAIAREKHLSFDRDQHRKRLARLEGGIATLRLGGSSAIEIADRQKRAQSASAAVQAAQEGGVVPGGSAALIHAGRRARAVLPDDFLGRLVGQVFEAGLHAPLRIIADNAGLDGRMVVHRLAAGGDDTAFDVLGQNTVGSDFLGDPLPVLNAALSNAVSTASRLLGASVTITSDAA